MLDPRIYRAGLIVAALGLIVLAFSLANQPGGSRATLAPGAFDGHATYASMKTLYGKYPSRAPGSRSDDLLGHWIAGTLGSKSDGFSVRRDRFTARTVDGNRRLDRRDRHAPGHRARVDRDRRASGWRQLAGSRRAVGHRHAARARRATSPVRRCSARSCSPRSRGTAGHGRRPAARLELAAVRSTRSSCSATWPRCRPAQPIVIPWSTTTKLAPPALVNTVSRALAAQRAAHAATPGTLASSRTWRSRSRSPAGAVRPGRDPGGDDLAVGRARPVGFDADRDRAGVHRDGPIGARDDHGAGLGAARRRRRPRSSCSTARSSPAGRSRCSCWP